MKKYLSLFLLAGVVAPSIASAQMIPTKRAECVSRCLPLSIVPLDAKAAYDARMIAIRAKKKDETNLEKIKELEQEEAEANEILTEAHAKKCTSMCRHNPVE